MTNSANDQLKSQVYILSFNQDPLLKLTEQLLVDHCNILPDLSSITVILPDMSDAAECRKMLLKFANSFGCSALLGPNIKSLQSWSNESYGTQFNVISDYARELILVEALLEHPELYGKGSPWLLANSLLELFNQLNKKHVILPKTLEQFTELLSQAYGMDEPLVASLNKEAYIVYTLWQAMQAQLNSQRLIDRETAHSLGLNYIKQTFTADNSIYITGYDYFTRAELDWINSSSKILPLKIFANGHALPESIDPTKHSDSTTSISQFTQSYLCKLTLPTNFVNGATPISEAIDYIYSCDEDAFLERSNKLKNQFKNSPIRNSIQIYLANSAENEAQAIDIQVREWLSTGISNIAIVTENRKLARRVRALLERSNIQILDSAGWALSTTSAATTIERLLQVVEEDYHYRPLLDLLKSPFIFPDKNRQQHLETVYRFEQGVIEQENISNGITRYLDVLAFRKNKLPADMAKYYDEIPLLLTTIENTLQQLTSLLQGQHNPYTYIEVLLVTLETLGIKRSLIADDAGNRLITELNLMSSACQFSNLKINWLNFRVWLGETLERFNFRPPKNNYGVQLLNLAQSGLKQFDALIVAGMEKEFLPGFCPSSPFFNDEVRATLGLDTQKIYQLKRFYQFRQLLNFSSEHNPTNRTVLLTARKLEGDEEISLSPWLEGLRSFHTQAYGDTLDAKNIRSFLEQSKSKQDSDIAKLVANYTDRPEVVVDEILIPNSISASGYQQLLDCPYQFYASRCLKLSPPEIVQKFLAKSDYGERVHLCLLAFHKNVDSLPGPFITRVTELNKESAIELLEQISKRIFSSDIEDNFIHRGWLKMWQKVIPRYINWQISQAQFWQPNMLEENIEYIGISPNLQIGGKIDRIDINQNKLCIIDYKTGLTPKFEDVLSGETVQLPFYALLANSRFAEKENLETSEIHYLSLSHDKFGLKTSLNKVELAKLLPQLKTRLSNIFHEMHNGQGLTAWGDKKTCSRCKMEGICRKQQWSQY